MPELEKIQFIIITIIIAAITSFINIEPLLCIQLMVAIINNYSFYRV